MSEVAIPGRGAGLRGGPELAETAYREEREERANQESDDAKIATAFQLAENV